MASQERFVKNMQFWRDRSGSANGTSRFPNQTANDSDSRGLPYEEPSASDALVVVHEGAW